MFGLSMTELMVLLIVGIVVVGPQKLPKMMRTLGQWIAKLRRMSTDLRAQSGIDEVLKHEGLDRDLRELRSLSRTSLVSSLVDSATLPLSARSKKPSAKRTPTPSAPPSLGAASAASDGRERPTIPKAPTLSTVRAEGTVARAPAGRVAAGARALPGEEPLAERERPFYGPDAYGALPDDLDDDPLRAIEDAEARVQAGLDSPLDPHDGAQHDNDDPVALGLESLPTEDRP